MKGTTITAFQDEFCLVHQLTGGPEHVQDGSISPSCYRFEWEVYWKRETHDTKRIPNILVVVYSLSVRLSFLVGGLVKFSSTSVGFS